MCLHEYSILWAFCQSICVTCRSLWAREKECVCSEYAVRLKHCASWMPREYMYVRTTTIITSIYVYITHNVERMLFLSFVGSFTFVIDVCKSRVGIIFKYSVRRILHVYIVCRSLQSRLCCCQTIEDAAFILYLLIVSHSAWVCSCVCSADYTDTLTLCHYVVVILSGPPSQHRSVLYVLLT